MRRIFRKPRKLTFGAFLLAPSCIEKGWLQAQKILLICPLFLIFGVRNEWRIRGSVDLQIAPASRPENAVTSLTLVGGPEKNLAIPL
jgi:hypothetical protein